MSTFKRCSVVLLDQQRETCVGLIQCIKDWKSFITPEEDFKFVGELSFGKNISDGVFEYWKPKALYILSNDISEIKDGDYVYVDCSQNETGYKGTGIWKFIQAPCPMPYWGNRNCCKKVIATTDETLGLPCPSKSFVMKYITTYNKGNIITSNIITEILVEYIDKFVDRLVGSSMMFEEIQPVKVTELSVSLFDNTITIRSIKNNYSEQEVQDILTDFAKSIDTVDKQIHPEKYVKAWIEENLVNPF